MKRIKKFLLLSPAERGLILRAVFFLCVTRAGLLVFSFRTLRSFLFRSVPPRDSAADALQLTPNDICRAVAIAARYQPGTSTCLARSLVAESLLAREGREARFYLGVAGSNKDNEYDPFRAHAWVESEGVIVAGDTAGAGEAREFTPLASMSGRNDKVTAPRKTESGV